MPFQNSFDFLETNHQTEAMRSIILLNKPFNVLSQFTDADKRETLSPYISAKGYYPAGRLDRDSEGLLLLTNDGSLQHQIAHPDNKMSKTYWVQVENIPTEESLQPLRDGIELKDGITQAATVQQIDPPYLLWDRDPPIRIRQSIPDCWLSITIREGKNRQVRRMTAAIGHPTLRLIRYRIGSWTIDGLAPGESRKLNA